MKKCKRKGSYKGCCCCNCSSRITIYAHPWNEEPHKGSIRKIIGYGCIALIKKGAIFSDRKHGMCELHHR